MKSVYMLGLVGPGHDHIKSTGVLVISKSFGSPQRAHLQNNFSAVAIAVPFKG